MQTDFLLFNRMSLSKDESSSLHVQYAPKAAASEQKGRAVQYRLHTTILKHVILR